MGNKALLKNQLLACTGCICMHIKATGLKSVVTEVSESCGDGAESAASQQQVSICPHGKKYPQGKAKLLLTKLPSLSWDP